ncbi:hypothetical protein AGLY_011622 [Aphis glycines]|uniref:Uncharacterized protein n=1 Tax=Aphis glycines TaxID=307491 RepID=A0A6G0TAQ8_APHGL|nr:hypothetical protein AGLY_011622 [Aphis glycines]
MIGGEVCKSIFIILLGGVNTLESFTTIIEFFSDKTGEIFRGLILTVCGYSFDGQIVDKSTKSLLEGNITFFFDIIFSNDSKSELGFSKTFFSLKYIKLLTVLSLFSILLISVQLVVFKNFDDIKLHCLKNLLNTILYLFLDYPYLHHWLEIKNLNMFHLYLMMMNLIHNYWFQIDNDVIELLFLILSMVTMESELLSFIKSIKLLWHLSIRTFCESYYSRNYDNTISIDSLSLSLAIVINSGSLRGFVSVEILFEGFFKLLGTFLMLFNINIALTLDSSVDTDLRDALLISNDGLMLQFFNHCFVLSTLKDFSSFTVVPKKLKFLLLISSLVSSIINISGLRALNFLLSFECNSELLRFNTFLCSPENHPCFPSSSFIII